MRGLLIAILLCIVPLLSKGQAAANHQLDSLFRALKSAKSEKNDSLTIRTLCELGQAYFNIDRDSAQYYPKKALDLAKRKGSQESLAYVYLELGNFYSRLMDHKLSMTYFDTSVTLYQKTQKIINKKEMFLALESHAYSAWQLGQYDKATREYDKILSSEDIHEIEGFELMVLVNMAYMYDVMKKKNKSTEIYEKALPLAIKSKDRYAEMILQNNLSANYGYDEQFEKAIQHSRRSIQLAKELNFTYDLILHQAQMGALCTEVGVHDSAEYYLLLAYKGAKEIKEVYHLSIINLYLAMLYIKTNNIAQARKYGIEALQCAQQSNSEIDIADAFEILYDIEKQSNNLDKATQMADSLLFWRDSLYKMNNQRELANAESAYNHTVLIKENELKTSEIRRLNITRNLIIIAILLLLLILLALWIQYKRKVAQRALQQELLYTERLTKNMESYRKKRATELHDDVGQDLLLAQQSIQLNHSPEQTKEFIERALSKLRRINKDEFPYELSYVGLKKSLEYLIDLIEKNANIIISEELCDTPKEINAEQSLNIYRIVQELINNSIKNPSTSAVFIGMEIKENVLELLYKDNGKGFNFEKQLATSKYFGLKIIVNRVRMLKGQLITVPSVADNRYVIHVPL